MLRSLSRAGLSSSSSGCTLSSAVRWGSSVRSSMGSTSPALIGRRSNATTATETESVKEQAKPIESVHLGSSEGSDRVDRKRPIVRPGIVRLHPYTDRFLWNERRDDAVLVKEQIQAAAANKQDPISAERDLWRLGRRMGPHPGAVSMQHKLAGIISSAVAEVLPGQSLVTVGPLSWNAAVSSTNPKLALRPKGRAETDFPPLAERTKELKLLVAKLKANNISTQCDKGVLRAHFVPTTGDRGKSAVRPNKVTISHMPADRLIANAIIASYMVLSPHRLVPLFRAVTAIPNKLSFCELKEVDTVRAVLAICYLQSLPQELLPRLHLNPTLKDFGIRRNSIELPTSRTGTATAKVDYTYLPLGLSDSTLDKIGFTKYDEEIKFVRSWRDRPAPNLQELLSGFYYWYAGEVPARFDWARDAVSVKGRRTRESVDPEGKFAKDAMVIIDPLNPYINLAAGFTHTKEAINEAFMEALRDELVSDPEVKLETLIAQPGSKTSERKQPPSLKRPAKKAADAVADQVLPGAGVESLEAAVPEETALPESVGQEVKEDASTLVEQVRAQAEEVKDQVVEKVEAVKEQVQAKVDEVKKD